jgi:ATP synthase protein I
MVRRNLVVENNFKTSEVKSIDKRSKTDKINLKKSLPVYFNLGFYLITPVLVGVFLGLYLDNRLKSKPTFVLAGIIFGTLALFYNLFKIYKD